MAVLRFVAEHYPDVVDCPVCHKTHAVCEQEWYTDKFGTIMRVQNPCMTDMHWDYTFGS